MASRSTIAIQNSDDTIDSIYCHFDGYLEHNGQILLNCWQQESSIRELIALGDLSSLGGCLSDCVAYHRDKAEPWEEVKSQMNMLRDEYLDSLESYNYLFKDGLWFVSDKLLTQELIDDST